MNARFQPRTPISLVALITVVCVMATVFVGAPAEATDGYGVSSVAAGDSALLAAR